MNDKTALWLYEISTDWHKPQWIKAIAEMFLPRCEYRHWETKKPCKHVGTPCYLPSYTSEGEEDEVIQWVCYEHVVDAGFCCSCHQFCAGIESFDFGDTAGYCDNCGWDLERERDREEWEEWESEYEAECL